MFTKLQVGKEIETKTTTTIIYTCFLISTMCSIPFIVTLLVGALIMGRIS